MIHRGPFQPPPTPTILWFCEKVYSKKYYIWETRLFCDSWSAAMFGMEAAVSAFNQILRSQIPASWLLGPKDSYDYVKHGPPLQINQ